MHNHTYYIFFNFTYYDNNNQARCSHDILLYSTGYSQLFVKHHIVITIGVVIIVIMRKIEKNKAIDIF